MIDNECRKGSSRYKESDRPGSWDIITAPFKKTCKEDEPTLGHDRGNAVESRSHPNKSSLERFRETQHIKTISRGIVSCRTESHKPEESKGILKEPGSGNEERNAGQ